jgi:multiple sugar transport system permease protein
MLKPSTLKSSAELQRPATIRQLRRRMESAGWQLLSLAVGVMMTFPFLWMLSTSLKPRAQLFQFPPVLLPSEVMWSNYVEVWTRDVPMLAAYFNSIKITSLVTFGTLLSCSLAAYAFAKITFPGRNLLFALLLATLMIPQQVTLVPVYILMARIGWVDTHWPLIVPPILTNAFGVFLLRQFFLGIPNDLLDSARVDGANPPQIFRRIALPLVKPALVTVAIFTMLSNWNAFLAPLIYLNDPEKFTIPLVIGYFRNVIIGPEWEIMTAAITTALAPMLLIYLFAQRYFIASIAVTGLKG